VAVTSPTLFDTTPHAEFDAEFPGVWPLFCQIVAEVREAGETHWSADGVLHVMRYRRLRKQWDGPKVNNNWSAYLARRWRAAHPEAPEFFALRRSKHDQEAA
jgi:hypothetical protein